MNRRRFCSLSVVSIAALPIMSAEAQRRRTGSRLLVSETSGAEIDISQTSFTLVSQLTTEPADFTFEVLHLESDIGMVWLQFISGPGRLGFSHAYQRTRDTLSSDFNQDEIEELGSQSVDGGGWMSFLLDDDLITYSEMQEEAYTGVNLWIEVQAYDDDIQAAFEEIQLIDIDGMPPFLFLEESDARGDLFTRTNGDTESGQLAIPNRRSSGGTTTQIDTGSTNTDVVVAVRAHQAQFHEEYDRFNDVVNIIVNGSDGEIDNGILFADLLEIMLSWAGYPEAGSGLEFSSQYADLEIVYGNWIESIGATGIAMGAWMLGEGEIDDFTAALNASVEIDAELTSVLSTIGDDAGARRLIVTRDLIMATSLMETQIFGTR